MTPEQIDETNRAAARVQAFLPELVDIPDEPIATQRGAQMLADDIRTVLAHRSELVAENANLRALLSDFAPRIDSSAIRATWSIQ